MQSSVWTPSLLRNIPGLSEKQQIKHGQWKLLVWYSFWFMYWTNLWISISTTQTHNQGQRGGNEIIIPYSVSHFCLQDNLGPFCFLIFLGILALSATFIYLYLPETKGKSIMEIKAEFNKLNFGKKEISVTENNFPKDQLFCTKLWMFKGELCILYKRQKTMLQWK